MMRSELSTTAVRVVNPESGELLTLDSPTEDLAGYLADVREHESLLREAKRAVTGELHARMDHEATWTVHAGGFKLSGQSPAPVEEWDGATLRTELLALVDEGVLSIEAVDAAVETVVTFKPRKAGIAKLRKLGGRVAEVIDGLVAHGDRERRVSVSRA